MSSSLPHGYSRMLIFCSGLLFHSTWPSTEKTTYQNLLVHHSAPPLPLPFHVHQSPALASLSPDVQRAEEQGIGILIPLHSSFWPRTKGSCHSNHRLAPTSLRNKYEWIHRKSHGPLLYRHWELRTELWPPPKRVREPLLSLKSDLVHRQKNTPLSPVPQKLLTEWIPTTVGCASPTFPESLKGVVPDCDQVFQS